MLGEIDCPSYQVFPIWEAGYCIASMGKLSKEEYGLLDTLNCNI